MLIIRNLIAWNSVVGDNTLFCCNPLREVVYCKDNEFICEVSIGKGLAKLIPHLANNHAIVKEHNNIQCSVRGDNLWHVYHLWTYSPVFLLLLG